MKRFYIFLLAAVMLVPAFATAQTTSTELTNLVVFVRFADDEEIDHPFDSIDAMFNSRQEGYYSVYNYYDAMTYGRIHYNTVYTSNVQNGVIVSYRDTLPRGAYQPWSETNPIGYQFEIPFMGVCMFEAQLLARILDYVDSLHLVPDSVVLDGNGDGFIDNVSFVVKGGVGEWASLLWPHMEYFPHDSIDHPVTVNGVRPNTFNFEFEGAGEDYFNTGVFCHEMGHSLGLPDLYHYVNYRDVMPGGYWDIMSTNALGPNHTAAIYKHKILHVCDAPIEITADGDYTLLSVGSSPSRNCYYIRSSEDTNQWFTFEYRNNEDPFEQGLMGSGLLAARWVDSIPLDYSGSFANAFFDGGDRVHQYWIFRPGSENDTVQGSVFFANFGQSGNGTSFGPSTDPHPYRTDGTPETSFEITNIYDHGDSLTFHVHFLSPNGIGNEPMVDNVKVYAQDGNIVVLGADGEQVQVFDVMGRRVAPRGLRSGVYVVKVGDRAARKVVVAR